MLNLKSLVSEKSKSKLGVFVVEGEKFAGEIPSDYYVLQYVASDKYEKPTERFAERAPVVRVSDARFQRIAGAATPQGILAVVERRRFSLGECMVQDGFALVCEGLGDPGNVGSLIRTAAAASASGVVMTKDSVSLWNPKTQRASAGAQLRLPIAVDCSIDDVLCLAKSKGCPVYAAHHRLGALPYDLDLSGRFCLVLGSESHGLSDFTAKNADALVRLPMSGLTESLSVAAAGSVLMYEAVRQRGANGLA